MARTVSDQFVETLCTAGVKRVYGSLGDGSQLGLPVKVVVLDNGTLGFIKIEQRSTGLLDFSTGLKNPDFATMAEAVGTRGFRSTDRSDVRDAFAAALAHNGPALVDAVVDREELAIPPSVSCQLTVDFSLFMAEAVLSGKANELLALALTNLWRLTKVNARGGYAYE